ncbi:MAG: hypothetical protein NVSMB45_09000 [Ginsengibacter sp.]
MIATITSYRSSQDIETSLRYVEGHAKVLESYGVKKVTSSSNDWVYDDQTYVVIVESLDKSKIYGGARIQIRSEKLKLPMEHAIARIDSNIYNYVDKYGDYNVAEFCGLFNSKEVAGYGIGSMFVGRIAMAIASEVNIKYLIGLCSPATLRYSMNVGFEVLTEIGNRGKFYYPKEGLIATSIIINDIQNLPNATDDERNRIFDLRANPNQTAIESGPKGELELIYQNKLR